MTITIKCSYCKNSFQKDSREYNRQIRNKKTNFYCSHKCLVNSFKSRVQKIIVECPECNKKFQTGVFKNSKRKFCSKKCANKNASKYIDYNKVSQGLKKFYKNNPYKKKYTESPKKIYYKDCVICKCKFELRYKKHSRKTCSEICYRKLISKNSRNNLNCGGSTNYKKFQYKGIWMDSSWEVELAQWMDKHNIKWIRDKKINFIWADKENKNHYYFPDFYLPDFDIYLDPKNKFLQRKDKFKLMQVKQYYNINLVSGELDFIKNFLKKVIDKNSDMR